MWKIGIEVSEIVTYGGLDTKIEGIRKTPSDELMKNLGRFSDSEQLRQKLSLMT